VTALKQALHAYNGDATATRTPRRVEYEVFARATRGLANIKQFGPEAFPSLAAALDLNRRLWTQLAVDVSNSENGLPAALRAQIFYLAEFTDQHSSRVLAGQATVEALIDINTAVMRGLGRSA
jgi:flagellar biosynthesis activator protein FlaF